MKPKTVLSVIFTMITRGTESTSMCPKAVKQARALRFDGIAGKSTVYLNGCLMYHNFSSYNTFEIDISDYVYYDKENVIAVYVNTEGFEGWWYQGGGIYRDVHLTVTEPVAIDIWGVYAPYKKLDDNRWQINFETTVVNTDYENKKVILKAALSARTALFWLSARARVRWVCAIRAL